MTAPRQCTRCILPENFPGIRFDAEGLCSQCKTAPSLDSFRETRTKLRLKMETVLSAAKESDGDYHCIIAYSGGKDSTYTLAMFTQHYKLRCLAVTVDNGFLSPQAVENCRVVVERLGVDHIFYKPSFGFMSGMYKTSVTSDVHVKAAITRASAICNSCINVVNTYVIKLALATKTPVIAGGYVGGQVPKDSAVMDLDVAALRESRAKTMAGHVKAFGPDASLYMDVPKATYAGQSVVILNPLVAMEYRVEDALKEIALLGWKKPTDTGLNSSNCRLNDFGIREHYKRFGFNPYVMELAEHVRYGLMDRDDAMKKALSIPTEAEVKPIKDRLGLSGAEP